MKLPIIITNFKTYESAIGKRAVALAKIHEKVALETGVNIAVAVQSADIFRVAHAVSIPVFAQHIDAVSYGSFTGHVLPEAVKEAGAFGTLINHSEHRVGMEHIASRVQRALECGLMTVVCAETAEEGQKIMTMCSPDFIAVEPPELIGGNVSVAEARPELISQAVFLIGQGKVLVGAGVKNRLDVAKALELQSVGILLASGVTKAEDPESVLRDLASALC